MKISPFKYLSYASSMTCSVIAAGGFLYMTSQNQPYKVHLPSHVDGDIIAGNPKGKNVIYIFLSDDCIHCKKWEKTGKSEFENYAKKNSLEIVYRKMKINSPVSGSLDKNTTLFEKAGVTNTPSFIFNDIYYKGAPSEKMLKYIISRQEKPASLKGKPS